MRLTWIFAAMLLAGCAPAPPPPLPQPKPEVTAEDWYAPSVEQLAKMSHDAELLLTRGRADEAGKIVTDAQPLINKLLAAPRPTLAAMEAASDLDRLYGRMLIHGHRYGWARMTYQKNVVRWKAWKPQTDETRRRLRVAESDIAECDRLLAEK